MFCFLTSVRLYSFFPCCEIGNEEELHTNGEDGVVSDATPLPLPSSSGVSLLLFVFLSGTRTRFCFLATDFFQDEHVEVSVFETQTKQGVRAYEVLGLSYKV